MSTCSIREISCPGCGAVNKSRMWIGMEASADPELRRRILDETLFDWKCPDCGAGAQMIYPCLYCDRENGFLVCLSPNGRTPAVREAEQRLPEFPGVKKRLVDSAAALKEKILIFEAGLDDLAVEMVKLALRELVEKKRAAAADRAFYLAKSGELDYIGFEMFLSGVEKPVYQGVRMEVYRKAVQVAQSSGFADEGFQQVDAALAQTLLEQQ